MGENFLADQAKRFKHRMAEGRRQLPKPDLLSRSHPVFQQAYTCKQLGTGELPDTLTVELSDDGLRVSAGNRLVGVPLENGSAHLRDATNQCGGLLGVRVTRRSPFTGTFEITCDPESDE